MTYAYAYRSGEIGFGRSVPKNAIPIGKGGREFTAKVRVRARLAYDNKTWLVPGIPEAANDTEAFAALKKFKEFVRK